MVCYCYVARYTRDKYTLAASAAASATARTCARLRARKFVSIVVFHSRVVNMSVLNQMSTVRASPRYKRSHMPEPLSRALRRPTLPPSTPQTQHQSTHTREPSDHQTAADDADAQAASSDPTTHFEKTDANQLGRPSRQER
ncbi:hypothetical protein HPB51_024173 [Rhipicephalus microplus]|uniref:Uncharacterized protein n=1 Tax=Rhipicephalus microplus TaxID=6941 RepID=A0A9J6DX03_RHIMP|nr:hypothetical protein HPB51_024173 [Rhipicephalus microplus]